MTRRWPFFRRKRLFVRRFQLRFVAASLVWFGTALLVVAGLVFLPLILELRSAAPSAESLAAADALLTLHDVFWPWMGVVLLLFTVQLSVLSHRIAGPLVRFRAVFSALERGNLTDRVRIRKHDYLHQEAAALDGAVAALRGHHTVLRWRITALETRLHDLSAASAKDPELVTSRLEDVLADARSLREEIERMQFETPAAPAAVAASSSDPGVMTRVAADRHLSQDGFTLIEMMLVGALITTLAAIAIPAYAEAIYSARVTKAISEIRAMGHTIQIHALVTGSLPASLADVDVQTLNDPWGRPYVYFVIPPKGAGGTRKDRNLVPINSDFDLYSVGRDGVSVPALTANASKDDVVRANDGAFIGLAAHF